MMRGHRSESMTTINLAAPFLVLSALLVVTSCEREMPVAESETSPIEAIADEVLAATMKRYPTMYGKRRSCFRT